MPDNQFPKATFAAGCFWKSEEFFRNIKGVKSTQVGYTGGHVENPTYQEVCTGKTGHAEAVEITFDPKVISYEDLLELFWAIHDPTTLNQQGPDIGTQYRSAIFYHDEAQYRLALLSKETIEKSGKIKGPVVTEIKEATAFYPAEEYHQCYLEKKKRP